MALLQFPSSPSVGDIYQNWRWDGEIWLRGGGGTIISATPPPDAMQGEMWWRDTDGQLFVWYRQNGQAQWVIANSGGGAWPPQGVTDGSDAPPGAIGQYVYNWITGNNLGANTPTNAVSVSLTAGDWDVHAACYFAPSNVIGTNVIAALTLTSATLPTGSSNMMMAQMAGVPSGSAWQSAPAMAVPNLRLNVASTTTVYLVVYAGYTSGSMQIWANIKARRMR